MMTVRKVPVFPATEQEIYRKLQKLKTLQYILLIRLQLLNR